LDADLGAAGGSVQSTGGTFMIQGGGAPGAAGSPFGGTADGGHFVYQALAGDGAVVAQVTGGAGQAGLMVRDGLAANGREAALFLAADGIHFQSRTVSGAAASDTVKAGPATPTWLKIIRNGNFISGYSSPTGTDDTW